MNTFDAALTFKTIVEQGSMTKAADFLNLSPSVVSKQLGFLENKVGLQLLKRTTRHIQLTEPGEVFYERICGISSGWDALLEEVNSLNNAPTGTLQISSPQPLCSRLIVPALKAFQTMYPNIKLELVHTSYEKLPILSADVTVSRRLDEFNSSSYISVPLLTYQNSLFASPSYLKHHSAINCLDDLSTHQCLTYGVGKSSYSWCFNNTDEISIQPYMTSDNTEIIISSAVEGLGIAYIPELIIQKEINNKQLVNILPDNNSQVFETNLYYQKLKFTPQKTRLFIDFLKDYF